MPDYILLMRDDAARPVSPDAWGPHIAGLQAADCFQGGSAIGAGVCVRKAGPAEAITPYLSGFIRVSASDLAAAKALVIGNPVFEAGGTVEIRELPRTD